MKPKEPQHNKCSACGAAVYPEHLDSGIARYEGNQLLCSFCVSDYEKKHDGSGVSDSEAGLDPISIQDDDEPAPASRTRIHAISSGMFGGGHAWDDSRFKRKLDPNSSGATRCRTFHSKLNEGSIEFMTTSINEWLDSDANIQIKFATSTIGIFEGKHAEPNLIVTLFY